MDTYNLERPVVAVDVVVFSIHQGRLMVLAYQRSSDPFIKAPALPGVAVQSDELLEAAARRSLREKVQGAPQLIREIYLEQLATFDALYRDPRGRTISVAYMGLTRSELGDFEKVKWLPVLDLSKGSLPFDHYDIVHTALDRLRGKLRYTNIAKGFLEQAFRIEELQQVYEAILRHPLNRTNFRNKLLKINMIEQVSVLRNAVGRKGGRPPHLYQFTQDLIEAVDRDFL
jgi:8-oxo-dGTP diphosphatase